MSKTKKKSWKQRVLEFFQERGEQGATADEAVTFFGSKNYSNVTARITEMLNGVDQRLFGTGRYRKTRRGRDGAVLVAKQPTPTYGTFIPARGF